MFDKKFDIKLNQDSYFIGEKVTGRIDLLTEKGIKAQNVQFYAYGKEEIEFKQSEGEVSVKYLSNDIFFTKDLTSFLKSSGVLLESGKIEIPEGVREIPFEFIIPTNALESYDGKNVKITYRIYLHVNRKWMAPIEKEKFFIVSSALSTGSSYSNISKEMDLEGIELKLELGRNVLSPGETLNGKLSIENSDNKDIRDVKVILRGYEYVIGFPHLLLNKKTDKLEYTQELEKYNSNIEWKREGEIMNFQLHVPENAKRSYQGKFSKYFWIVDVKFDIPWGQDIHGKHEIEIR
jgi:hypothetical protein